MRLRDHRASERRHGCGETDADVRAKTTAAWRAGLVAIVCVGETRAEREAGRAIDIVAGQLAGSLPEGADAARLVVAYEPVWAIGTGLTPTIADIAAIHDAIRGVCPVRHENSVRRLGQSEKRRRNPCARRGRWRLGRWRQPQGRRFLGDRAGGGVNWRRLPRRVRQSGATGGHAWREAMSRGC